MHLGKRGADQVVNRRRLPDLLERIAEACGTNTALRVAEVLGGRKIKVPRKATPKCALARSVGLEAAAAIVEMYGGEVMLVPLGPASWYARWQDQIAAHTEAGLSIAATAKAVGVHERTVERHRKAIRSRQEPPLLRYIREGA